jgi:hypothetical protein
MVACAARRARARARGRVLAGRGRRGAVRRDQRAAIGRLAGCAGRGAGSWGARHAQLTCARARAGRRQCGRGGVRRGGTARPAPSAAGGAERLWRSGAACAAALMEGGARAWGGAARGAPVAAGVVCGCDLSVRAARGSISPRVRRPASLWRRPEFARAGPPPPRRARAARRAPPPRRRAPAVCFHRADSGIGSSFFGANPRSAPHGGPSNRRAPLDSANAIPRSPAPGCARQRREQPRAATSRPTGASAAPR